MSRPPLKDKFFHRGLLGGVALAALVTLAPNAGAQQIVPADFFSQIPSSSGGDMAVSADTMVFDSSTDTVVAQGNVGISFEGYRALADRAVYYQTSGRVELIGNVSFIDPDGVEYVADRIELEDGFREGFIQSLTVAFPDGTYFTAADTNFNQGVERVYTEGTYAPCGTCIDEDGNRIGWTVKAARIVTDEAEQIIYFEEPSLQLLGVSVLWLPWLELPSDEDIDLPVLSYDGRYGVGISMPFFRYRIADGTLAVTPALYTNQGAGLTLDWRQRVGDLSYTINASGVAQLNPDAYTGLANRAMRGAIGTTGRFTPTDEWTLGWSYTAFTDPGYLRDYRIAPSTITNEVYATYLDTDTYANARIEQHLPLGNRASWNAFDNIVERQAVTHPNARADHVIDLDDGMGRVELAGKLLGLTRLRNHVSASYGGNRYAYGYESQSVHAMAQASWTNQYILPGGLTVSPYLGLRGDAAHVEAGAIPDNCLPGGSRTGTDFCQNYPDTGSLLSATPIAALDIRYPLIARASGSTTVIEPIAQLVYRGGPALPGITNDDSQTFVFDDTNLFSFNRFSGMDRQETGLRANVGGQFQTSFDNGVWVGGVLGQSFRLAGTNAFALTDGTPAGIASGMDSDASYVVAGLQAGYGSLTGGAKAQVDPATGEIPRAQLSLGTAFDDYRLAVNYVYIAASPVLGSNRDRNEVQVVGSMPLGGYWSANGMLAWDLDASEFLEARAAIEYDDSFLAYGAGMQVTGATHRDPEELRIGVSLRLSGAGRQDIVNFDYGFSEF